MQEGETQWDDEAHFVVNGLNQQAFLNKLNQHWAHLQPCATQFLVVAFESLRLRGAAPCPLFNEIGNTISAVRANCNQAAVVPVSQATVRAGTSAWLRGRARYLILNHSIEMLTLVVDDCCTGFTPAGLFGAVFVLLKLRGRLWPSAKRGDQRAGSGDCFGH